MAATVSASSRTDFISFEKKSCAILWDAMQCYSTYSTLLSVKRVISTKSVGASEPIDGNSPSAADVPLRRCFSRVACVHVRAYVSISTFVWLSLIFNSAARSAVRAAHPFARRSALEFAHRSARRFAVRWAYRCGQLFEDRFAYRCAAPFEGRCAAPSEFGFLRRSAPSSVDLSKDPSVSEWQ